MQILITGLARLHLEDGANFYEAQQPELGQYFLECLQTKLKSLAIYAGIHAKEHGFHRTLANPFPFAVYYLKTGDEVTVCAVIDCRRDPRSIKSDLKDAHESEDSEETLD